MKKYSMLGVAVLGAVVLVLTAASSAVALRAADWKSRELCERICRANESPRNVPACVRACMRSWQR